MVIKGKIERIDRALEFSLLRSQRISQLAITLQIYCVLIALDNDMIERMDGKIIRLALDLLEGK